MNPECRLQYTNRFSVDERDVFLLCRDEQPDPEALIEDDEGPITNGLQLAGAVDSSRP